MPFDPTIHDRRSIRLDRFDYATTGAYFITICTERRIPFFGSISASKMQLNPAGEMLHNYWKRLNEFERVATPDEFIVMPNHVHGIVFLDQPANSQSIQMEPSRASGTLPGSLGRVVGRFKSSTTNLYISGVKKNGWQAFPGTLWQRNYFEHVIRDDDALESIREYIRSNPENWDKDFDNPGGKKTQNVAEWLQSLNAPAAKQGRSQGSPLQDRRPPNKEGDHEDRPYT